MRTVKMSPLPEGDQDFKLMASELARDSIVTKAHARFLEQTLMAVNEDTIQPLRKELEETYTKIARLTGLIEEALRCLEGEPEYHIQGMGCGLEDRGITDRYEAMEHGWDKAMERVFGENIAWAKDALQSAIREPK